jgi:hypothetical protein
MSHKRKNMSLADPMDCVRPKFHKQTVITASGVYLLGDRVGSKLIVVRNALDAPMLDRFAKAAVQVERVQGSGVFGRDPPRLELCYTPSGKSYKYSGRNHATTTYPQHVLEVLPTFMREISAYLGDESNEFTVLSNGVDIIYSNRHACGGSITAHSDDEDKWGLVLIYTLGQTRYLRVRGKTLGTFTFTNVRMDHNSLVVMYGKHFQRNYTHQVDKLSKGEPIGTRISLNVRYKSEKPEAEQSDEKDDSSID